MLENLSQARELIGKAGALAALIEWKTPFER